jgi:transcriptional regulator with PAS, ATPase and Fis domain
MPVSKIEYSSLKDILARTEKKAIIRALEATGNNKVRAADLLCIHRTLLYKKMKKYGIELRIT